MEEIALYIDIEGFSKKFENGGRQSFIKLSDDLFKLGQNYFTNLSIIQFGGDGFLIKEVGRYTNDLNKFLELGVILLKAITLRGGMGRIQISSGTMADISGLYSEDLIEAIRIDNNNLLYNTLNIMTINPIIGDAIINCVKLIGPKGPLLLIDEKLLINKDQTNYTELRTDDKLVFDFNWLNFSNEFVSNALTILGLDESKLFIEFEKYLRSNSDLKKEWKNNAIRLI
jgi:hypothetical protein